MARKILLLTTDLEIGGTPTVVRELAIRLREERGVVVQVACLGGKGVVAEQLQAAGVAVTALGAKGPRDIGILFSLVRLIRAERFDTVFSFLIHANAMAAGARVFCRGVRFLQSIQTTQRWPRWHWKLQGIIQHAAEKIVAPSQSVARAAREWADVPGEKIVVIPNAVDLAEFAEIAERARDGGVRRVGFIGRLDRVKRVGDLIRAIAIMGPEIGLDIYGEGSEREALGKQIRELGIEGRVILHGAVGHAREAMKQIDLLALPSEAEGFGLVLIEAMAAGMPVVATDVPGIRDVVRNGVTGILVPVGDPVRLAAAIAMLAGDAGLRRALARAGLEEVRRRFSWEEVMGKYREVLEIDADRG